MWLKQEDFIHRKLQVLCADCGRRARIIVALRQELPKDGSFDEMNLIFEKIEKREI